MKESDEQYTPKWIFDALDVQFDLDVCAPQGGVDYIPANKHYSLADDSLSQNWEGFVWMNPPFSEGKIWHNKFLLHGNGICLAPMSKSQWFYDVWNNSDISIAMPTPVFKFQKPNGKPNSIFMPVVLYAIGAQGCLALANSNISRIR
jgi:hypothetical protein